MALVVPNISEGYMLSLILGKIAQENMLLKLFSNDYTPVFGTVLGDLTELVATGYAAKTLVPADWTVTPAGASGAAVAAATQQVWIMTAAATVYGYYLVGATSGNLYIAEQFTDGPYVLDAGGGQVRVTPNFQGSSQTGN